MFLNNEDLFNTNSEEKIYNCANHLLDKSHLTERHALVDSVWRISQMVYWLYGDKDVSTYSSVIKNTMT